MIAVETIITLTMIQTMIMIMTIKNDDHKSDDDSNDSTAYILVHGSFGDKSQADDIFPVERLQIDLPNRTGVIGVTSC